MRIILNQEETVDAGISLWQAQLEGIINSSVSKFVRMDTIDSQDVYIL